MEKFEFRNAIGYHLFDESGKLIESSDKTYDKEKLPERLLQKALLAFKDAKFHSKFYIYDMQKVKQAIKESVTKDLLIIHSIRVIEDLNHVTNVLTRRVREWYEIYNPELSRRIDDHEAFIDTILKKQSEKDKGSMGADIDKQSLDPIYSIAKRLQSLYNEKEDQKRYIESVMKEICPNLLEIAGVLIGSKLIEHAGSLKHLSELPASTIQLLGAEKALFKHLKTGAKCPKYGLIFNHPYVSNTKARFKGKAARLLADKISIAVKVDYFKGEFIADKLKLQLEEKGKKLQ